MEETGLNKIAEGLKVRSIPKQDVFHNTKEIFGKFKTVVKAVAEHLKSKAGDLDERLEIEVQNEEEYAIRLKIAGDVIVCSMHSNVFNFSQEHGIHAKDYVKEDPTRSYCGMITFHNFLADSFKYNRQYDTGFLVSRVFVNRENHFFVEGHRQLGFLYNEFENAVINDVYIQAIIEQTIQYSLEFELLAPPFEHIKEISVAQMQIMNTEAGLKTDKHLGFQFSYMQEQPE